MSVMIQGVLIYGDEYANLRNLIGNLDAEIDADNLDYASPYYDAPRCFWTVGIKIPNAPTEQGHIEAVAEAKSKFSYLTGLQHGKVIACADVS